MKRLILILVVLSCISFVKAQEEVITKDGKTVILFKNGTWKYKATENINIEMLRIEGGLFTMGCKDDECKDEEKPLHKTSLKSYSIGKYEVKVSEYKIFCKETSHNMPLAPDWGWQDNHPIVNVSYEDAILFCQWISKKTGEKYRLPTEAEWEYAAMGGKKSKEFKFSGSDDIGAVAWYSNNAKSVEIVGTKAPNELGIYDMSGNVYEWCSDWYSKDYYKEAPMGSPQGPADGQFRVLRGGCWSYDAKRCRIASRYSRKPDFTYYALGFRVVKE